MIDFRYHVVSLVAVFLALTVGIVIGATALDRATVDSLRGQVATLSDSNRGLQGTVAAQSRQLHNGDAVIGALAPQTVAGELSRVRVVLVATAETGTGLTDAAARTLESAGATVTGRVQLTDAYTDPRRAADITAFATGGGQPAGLQLPQTTDSAVLGGWLLASVLVQRHGHPLDPAAVSQVLSGFASLQLVRLGDAGVRPADIAVVLATAPATGPDAAARTRALGQLVAALARAGTGRRSALVAGTAASAGSDGLVGAVRSDAGLAAGISTVDDADTAAGRVATVFAIRRQVAGSVGQYGDAASAQELFPPTQP